MYSTDMRLAHTHAHTQRTATAERASVWQVSERLVRGAPSGYVQAAGGWDVSRGGWQGESCLVRICLAGSVPGLGDPGQASGRLVLDRLNQSNQRSAVAAVLDVQDGSHIADEMEHEENSPAVVVCKVMEATPPPSSPLFRRREESIQSSAERKGWASGLAPVHSSPEGGSARLQQVHPMPCTVHPAPLLLPHVHGWPVLKPFQNSTSEVRERSLCKPPHCACRGHSASKR